MSQTISIEKKNELFENFQKIQFANHTDGFETIMELPQAIGKGFVREIDIRSGLKLIIKDFRLQVDFLTNVEAESPALGFGFIVSGRCKGTGRSIKDDFIIGPDQTCLSFIPDPKGTMKHSAGEHIVSVLIGIEPPLFSTFLEEEFDRIPADLQGVIDGSNENYFNRIGSMIDSVRMAVHQILNCPYQGLTKRMYLEGKTLELMALQLTQLVFVENGSVKPPILRSADIERIHEAKDILVANAENPPSLLALARQVGLNDYKLKIGFRQVFGTTAFGYLQKHRMEQARLLLENGRINVTGVACAVGYSSLSHFAKIFQQHFGTKPSSYLRKTLGKDILNA